VGAELDRLDPAADLGRLGQVVLSPIRRGAVTSPLLRRPAGALCFAFNLVRLPDTDDPVAARLVAANRAAYERIRAAGGTLYPVSAFPMAPPDWRSHFGPAFARLAAARRTYDPRGVLTPGYEIFSGGRVETGDARSLPW
jgi:FAD/FMN-containing dehydrogenase